MGTPKPRSPKKTAFHDWTTTSPLRFCYFSSNIFSKCAVLLLIQQYCVDSTTEDFVGKTFGLAMRDDNRLRQINQTYWPDMAVVTGLRRIMLDYGRRQLLLILTVPSTGDSEQTTSSCMIVSTRTSSVRTNTLRTKHLDRQLVLASRS